MLDCRNGFEGIETSWIVEVCKAMMYVLHETLGLSEEKMIASMDEKRGKLLLAEIRNGGNFGQHLVRYYSMEALSESIFRTWHFFWRLRHK